MRLPITIPLLSCLTLPLSCQQKPAEDPLAEMFRTFAEAGIELDLEARSLSIEAEVGRPDQLLEYLLINPRGKGHEALLVTEVKPSLLNAALLALGFVKGENARMVDKDPMPSMEEIENGASYVDIFPPKGMSAWFTVSWQDQDGKDQLRPVEDLIVDMSTEKPLQAAEWIFLGGRMAAPYRGDPDVFLADLSHNLVSICYLEPPNHLITMSHERAADDQNWWVNAEICPKPGSKVQLTIHRGKPALLIERERRISEGKQQSAKTP